VGIKACYVSALFPHTQKYKKNQKKVKKVLDRPLTIVHNEYVERVNIKGHT